MQNELWKWPTEAEENCNIQEKSALTDYLTPIFKIPISNGLYDKLYTICGLLIILVKATFAKHFAHFWGVACHSLRGCVTWSQLILINKLIGGASFATVVKW